MAATDSRKVAELTRAGQWYRENCKNYKQMDELLAAYAASGWVDVKKELPKESGVYLTRNCGKIGHRCASFSKLRGNFWQSVTHWMEIPE